MREEFGVGNRLRFAGVVNVEKCVIKKSPNSEEKWRHSSAVVQWKETRFPKTSKLVDSEVN